MADLSKRLANLSPEQRELLLKKLKAAGKKVPRARINKRENQDDYPLSTQQKQLWFMQQLEPDSPFYSMPSAVNMCGNLDFEALEKSLKAITQRHEVLRAVFPPVHGEPQQRILPDIAFDLDPVDTEIMDDKTFSELMQEDINRPFNLATGPLIRVKLYRRAPDWHILLLLMHHIVSDGWSIAVFVEDFALYYSAFHKKAKPFLEPLPIQYADYAAWQNQWLQSQNIDKQLNYWLKQVSGAKTYLDLPFDRQRPAVPSFRGSHIPFKIPADLLNRLHRKNRQNGVTLFMSLMAAFQALLYLHTGQEDINVGTTIANREIPDLKRLMGFLINILIIRSDLSDNPRFSDFLKQIKNTALDAFANHDLPYERLVEALQPDRTLTYPSLFQILFVLQNAPKGKLALPDLEISIYETRLKNVKFDLTLIMEEEADHINGLMGFRSDLFDAPTIERFIRHYLTILDTVTKDDTIRLRDIPLLSAAEKYQILHEWNDTRKPLPDKRCIHHIFENQAETAPDATALIYEDRTLTYGELNASANRLAALLIEAGVGPEKIVAIAQQPTPDMIISLLAVLKTGGAFLPLDVHHPAERIRFIIEDTGTSFLLTEKSLHPVFENFTGKILYYDALQDELKNYSSVNPLIKTDLANLAYLIYTSGSTGKPKGVMLTHRGLPNLTMALGTASKVAPGSRVLQFASPSFDASVEEILTPLSLGATLVLMNRGEHLSAQKLNETIKTNKLTNLVLSPSLLTMLDPQDFPDLRAVTSMGETCPPELANQWSAHVRFINGYGPTENTVATAINIIGDKITGLRVPIGRPLDNVNVYILDSKMEPTPVGMPGEVYIGGIALARGYLNRPDLTADKFVPDPFSSEAGSRLYRTGDLGRFLPDGQIDFIGRVDDQVNIRSFRIELGEIETHLDRHPAVKLSAVAVKKDKAGNRQLAAYIVRETENELTAADIKNHLNKHVPEYMVPAFVVFLDEMPLKSSGKIDKDALPDPDSEMTGRDGEYVAPSTKLELFVYNLWREILKIERIGIHDNFFSIGGNSIQGAVFVNRLQEELGEYVYIVAIYDAPTIARLCDYIKKEYPQSAARISGEKIKSSGDARVTGEQIKALRRIIFTSDYKKTAEAETKKNPPAVFVLSSPRSGSTLTRAMLGGHPLLFSPPELQLLNYGTLQERKTLLSGRNDFWLDGTIRTIMELKNCDESEARKLMLSYEDRNFSTAAFYGEMQSWLNDRIFVDKTPNYALSEKIMQQAERWFDNPRFIHLIRHPYGVIPSFEKARLHVFYPPFFTDSHDFTPRQLAEMIWIISHQNILAFFNSIPQERRMRLRYEDLVTQPQEEMQRVCNFLDIDFHPDMLVPQKDKEKRMTTGLNELSKMLGDVRFHEHKGITSDRAYQWKNNLKENYLSDAAWELIEAFGYESRPGLDQQMGKSLQTIPRLPQENKAPLSFAQERLWFLDQLEPDSAHYNMPVAVRVSGNLDQPRFSAALQRLAQRQQSLRTVFKASDGKAFQQILPKANFDIRRICLTDTPPEKREEKAREMLRKEALKPFNLAEGPLLRVTLIEVDSDESLLLLNMHHIISDGLSLGIFMRELLVIYEAIVKNKAVKLAPLPVQYADYAAWQRSRLQSKKLENELEFWKVYFKDAPTMLELPTDFPRPAVRTFKGGQLRFQLSEALSRKIKNWAQEHDSTIFMFLLTALNGLLYRYARQQTILTGMAAANRNRREIENLIGFFINTLVIRADIERGMTFEALFEQLKTSAVAVFKHQDVPFEKIVDSLDIERNLSHNPLFQVMLTYQPPLIRGQRLDTLAFEPLELDTGIAKFDLNLSMAEHGGQIGGLWEYSSDLFTERSAARMLRHFQAIIECLLDDPQMAIDRCPLFDEKEYRQIIHEFNATPPLTFPAAKCLHQSLEEQAEAAPDQTAVSDGQTSLTFGELNAQANRLARYLMEHGVRTESIVAVLGERSVQTVVNIFAVLKAGAAYLPVDPAYPEERIAYMMADAGASFMLTSKETQLPAGIKILNSQALSKELGRQNSDNPRTRVIAEHLAYIIYTSGSTGKPKGVMISHRSAQHLAENLDQVIYSRNGGLKKRISLNAPFAFDASVQQLVMLTRGHTLYIIPDEVRYDGQAMLDYLRQHQIELLDCVPSQLKLLSDQGLDASDGLSLSDVLPGGEAIDEDLWNRLKTNPGINFYNMYGPTECTVDSTICPVKQYPDKPTIGRPVSNARFYVLDDNLNPVPANVIGELHIAGAGLARGYLNRPALTAANFIPDPFSGQSGERMYKTGDLVRSRADRTLSFAGRADHQVKLRGFRIELGEIENALLRHENVAQAVVIVREDKPGHQRLAAYLVPTDSADLPANQLRDYLSAELPEYMIPSHFVLLDVLPLNPHGKIDRKALPVPKISQDAERSDYMGPTNEKEEILAGIWQDLLNIQAVDIHDNFFELGGDSIISIQVIARARQMGLHLTPKDLFENPTIEKLARAAKKSTAVKAEQGMIEGGFELLPVQHNFFERQLKNPHHFNQALMLEVRESLDPHLLEQTLRKIMEHHDALRLRFGGDKDKQQPVFENTIKSLPFDYHDLSKSDGNNLDDRINDAGNQAQQSLDIEKGPMLRMTYFHLPEGRGDRLHIVCHHLVIDGVSWRILLEDIQSVYRRLEKKQTLRLPLKTSSVKDWSQALQQYAKSEAMQPEIKYWQALTAKPFTALPEDNVQGGNSEAVSNIITVTLEKELTEALLRDVPPVYNTQINEILLTALLQSFKRRTGQDQLWILMEGHGRESVSEDVDLSRTVGWFTSLYPLFLSLGGVSELGEAIKSVKEQVRALPQNGIGYGVLRYLSDEKVQDAMRQLPDPQISFNYLGQFDQGGMQESAFAVRPAEEAGAERSPENDRTQLLDFSAGIHQGQFRLSILFSKEKFKAETITKLGRNFINELTNIIEYCQKSEQGDYTPSDFEEVDLDKESLDDLLSELNE